MSEKTNKTRRWTTIEALDSGTPSVANVGNPGDVWLAFSRRGETPQHAWLIHSRRALFVLIIFLPFFRVNVFFVLITFFPLVLPWRR